jgi:uncharacterized membrane protein YcaP (DUF421 family)
MDILNDLFGLDAVKLTATHMATRAVFVFIVSFFYMRIAGLRTFGKKSIFDQTTLLTIGAIMGRSIVSDSPFFPSMLAALILVLLHRFVAFISFQNKTARTLISGKPLKLIENGHVVSKGLWKAQITKEELMESLRMNGQINDLENVKESYLEPSGEISIIKKNQSG